MIKKMISGLENANRKPATTAAAPRALEPVDDADGLDRIIMAENSASNKPPIIANAAVWLSINPIISVMLSAATQQ